LSALTDAKLIPVGHQAVFLGGSVGRGWGNETSDFDFCVIVDEPWVRIGQAQKVVRVPLDPPDVPHEIVYVDDRQWEVAYWLDRQVDQMLSKVHTTAQSPDPLADMTLPEMGFLTRLGYATELDGGPWLSRRRKELAESPFTRLMTERALDMMDNATADAAGQLASGDVLSAVMSSRIAFGRAVDAVLASHGRFRESKKWRARQMAELSPPELPFERYWAVETMRDFDPDHPEVWVEEALMLCQELSCAIELP
jgi:hypothetical protein